MPGPNRISGSALRRLQPWEMAEVPAGNPSLCASETIHLWALDFSGTHKIMPRTLHSAIASKSARFFERHRLQAVLWDWDGVLVDSGYNFRRAYEMVLQDEGIVTDPREIYLREGQPTPSLLKAIFDLNGLSIDEGRINALVERRREYDFALGERKFFGQVPRLLKKIRTAGCRSGMVTGSSRNSLNRVLTEEQARWFDVIIAADDVKHPKPDPEPSQLAA